MLYQLVVFLHVACVLGYLLAHGVSAAVSFAIKKERDIARIRALLDLSAASYPLMMNLMWAFLLFGIIATIQGGWWKMGWVWVSLALGLVIFILMGIFGGRAFGMIRIAAGLPYHVMGKPFPAQPAKSDEEIYAAIAKVNPWLLLIIGYGGFAVIAWLMTAKPF
ncbi:MAG: hypothetical protein DCC59_07295 [Chloroflexi bacterium]|nr:hypothetical protein [Anaerolineales bacterium]RIK53384.1 MAG: hypothetical protein DCC59_07295 [Chloroflexota bacterium]